VLSVYVAASLIAPSIVATVPKPSSADIDPGLDAVTGTFQVILSPVVGVPTDAEPCEIQISEAVKVDGSIASENITVKFIRFTLVGST